MSQKCSIVTSLTLVIYIFKLCCVKIQLHLLINYIISVRRGSNNIFVSVLNVQVADMVLLNLCFIKNSVYPTNENTAVSHYINLIIFTLPSLSACGANEISLIIRYNLTPFSSTHKDMCVCPDEALKSDGNFTGLNWYFCIPSLSSLIQLRYIVCDGLIVFTGTGNGHSFST